VDSIVNRTRGVRSRTLSPDVLVKRTGGTFVPQTRTALGQGAVVPEFYIGEPLPLTPEEAQAPSVPSEETSQAAEIPIPEILRERSLPPSGEVTGVEVLLRRGDRGDQVRGLQLQLRRLGFAPGPVDGIFGPLTEQAVRQFQQSMGLPSTGLVDQVTWAAVQSAVPGGTPPTPGQPAPTTTPAPARPTSPAPSTTPSAGPPPEVQQFLGLPVGVWVILGVVVIALFATATPGPRPVTTQAAPATPGRSRA